jgi:N-acetylneuraminate synthase/N,N'-diacetyllegionaminate synthase
MKKTYVIAEAGVNHNGKIELAIELINQAKNAGADCIKFQTFQANQIVTKASPKADYQLKVTDSSESQFEMLKKLELQKEHYPLLINRCKELNIDFMSTPYNFEDVDFLDSLNVKAFKIASGQLTELPFLKHVARKQKTTIISTGMANLAEVFNGVQALREEGNNDIYALQCTTNYPSKIEDAHINSMLAIKSACAVRVGYSDHVENNYACFAAVALGAEIIEKHFTLDKNMEGPDHKCSLIFQEFKELVTGIRNVELSLGSSLKTPTDAEISNSFGMKRSIVATSKINRGETITIDKLGFKRPGNGLSPNMLNNILGKKAALNIEADDSLKFNSIEW